MLVLTHTIPLAFASEISWAEGVEVVSPAFLLAVGEAAFVVLVWGICAYKQLGIAAVNANNNPQRNSFIRLGHYNG